MCQEAVRRLCNPSESRHVRKVARLLARPLSRGSLDGHWLPPAWHPRRDRGQRVLLRRRGCRYGSRALLAPGALGPCSLLPTCSSFSYPLRTLAGQPFPPMSMMPASSVRRMPSQQANSLKLRQREVLADSPSTPSPRSSEPTTRGAIIPVGIIGCLCTTGRKKLSLPCT